MQLFLPKLFKRNVIIETGHLKKTVGLAIILENTSAIYLCSAAQWLSFTNLSPNKSLFLSRPNAFSRWPITYQFIVIRQEGR